MHSLTTERQKQWASKANQPHQHVISHLHPSLVPYPNLVSS